DCISLARAGTERRIRRSLQEAARFMIGRKQRLDMLTKLLIAGAGLIQIRSSLFRVLQLERLGENLFLAAEGTIHGVTSPSCTDQCEIRARKPSRCHRRCMTEFWKQVIRGLLSTNCHRLPGS